MNKKNINNSDQFHIPEKDLQKLVSAMKKTLEMGIGVVYGLEDKERPDAKVDCELHLNHCKAECCTFRFALTKEEVQKGHIRHNEQRPFFIARDKDGYCPHLDRKSLRCIIWEQRPLRCRRYDCSKDPQVSF